MVPVVSPALLFGESLFESIRAHQGDWLAVDAHRRRLLSSLQAFEWELSLVPEKPRLLALLMEGLELLGNAQEAYARMTVWPAGRTGGPGILPNTDGECVLLVCPLNSTTALMESETPITLGRAASIGRDAWATPYEHKHGNYLPSRWAMAEARSRGLDDVVMCRPDGSPVEASSSNLLAFDGDRWATPKLERNGLGGIARNALMQQGVVESAVDAGTLEKSSGLALVNSVRGLRFVREYEGNPLEIEGPHIDDLRRRWSAVVAGWRV